MRIWMFILILLRLLGESEVRCLWNRMRRAIQTRYITFRPSNMKQSITRTFYAKRINHLHHSLWFTNWFTKCWNGSSLKMQFSHCWWTDSTILFSPACLARYETADFCIKRNKPNIEKNPSWYANICMFYSVTSTQNHRRSPDGFKMQLGLRDEFRFLRGDHLRDTCVTILLWKNQTKSRKKRK